MICRDCRRPSAMRSPGPRSRLIHHHWSGSSSVGFLSVAALPGRRSHQRRHQRLLQKLWHQKAPYSNRSLYQPPLRLSFRRLRWFRLCSRRHGHSYGHCYNHSHAHGHCYDHGYGQELLQGEWICSVVDQSVRLLCFTVHPNPSGN